MFKAINFGKGSYLIGAICASMMVVGCGDDGEQPLTPAAIDNAVDFVGGADALKDMTGFKIEASGTRFALGEGLSFDAGPLEVSTFTSTLTYDLTNDDMRIDWMRTIGFLGGAPLNYSEVYDGGAKVGMVIGNDNLLFPNAENETPMLSSRWASGRKQQELLNPPHPPARIYRRRHPRHQGRPGHRGWRDLRGIRDRRRDQPDQAADRRGRRDRQGHDAHQRLLDPRHRARSALRRLAGPPTSNSRPRSLSASTARTSTSRPAPPWKPTRRSTPPRSRFRPA